MRVVVKKWGNGAAVRIPAVVLEATQLEIGEKGSIATTFMNRLISGCRKAKRFGDGSWW
jgi:antitoxin component of MazEF toxin-antitoxin module